jgi:hypothetical protein
MFKDHTDGGGPVQEHGRSLDGSDAHSPIVEHTDSMQHGGRQIGGEADARQVTATDQQDSQKGLQAAVRRRGRSGRRD